MDNITLQADEIEALCSIYESDWKINGSEYSINISEGIYDATVFIKLPRNYPRQSAPDLQLSAPNLPRNDKQELLLALNEIFTENNGEPVLYQWIEKIREFLQNLKSTDMPKKIFTTEEPEPEKNVIDLSELKIEHGSIIQDRKSIFQGHVACVKNASDVKAVMANLLENKKIAEATHNISAYRIKTDKNILQDCDDDGEQQAGKRLLHLLQIVDVANVLVVVSRWYGGVQLGPDRFRHINNAARQILDQGGYIGKKK